MSRTKPFGRHRHAAGAFFAALVGSTVSCDESTTSPDDGTIEQTASVQLLPDGAVVDDATATLRRTETSLEMTIQTHDLEPGDTYTIWWTIFNSPENCEHPDEPAIGATVESICGEEDIFGDAAGGSGFFAAGEIADADGSATFSASVSVDDDVRDCDFAAFGICRDGLTNPLGAEVQLFVRSHGPPIEGLVDEQLGTFAAGCTPESSFELGDGPNECVIPQVAVFSP